MNEKLITLQIVCRVQRFTYEGFITRFQARALFPHFNGYEREERIEIVSELLGHPVGSFNEISYGEAKALLDEPGLDDLIAYAYGQISEFSE